MGSGREGGKRERKKVTPQPEVCEHLQHNYEFFLSPSVHMYSPSQPPNLRSSKSVRPRSPGRGSRSGGHPLGRSEGDVGLTAARETAITTRLLCYRVPPSPLQLSHCQITCPVSRLDDPVVLRVDHISSLTHCHSVPRFPIGQPISTLDDQI